MILSTQTDCSAQKLGIVNAVGAIADAGFDAADISMFINESTDEIFSGDYKSLAKKMNEAAESHGIFFNQAHAPFPPIRVNDEEYTKRTWPKVLRAIEFAGLCGVKNIVVHPVVFNGDNKEGNLEMYNKLAPYAKDAGVKIALENMWCRDKKRGYIIPNVCSVPAELADYYDSLDPEVFTVCLDIGHCGLVGEDPADFIRYLGADRLGALHIHDNDYRNDSHMPPFMMNQEWDRITAALKEIGYRGDFTFEADSIFEHIPVELVPATLKYMHDIGRHLITMFENA